MPDCGAYAQWTTAEAAHAAGAPVGRLNQRIKEGRLDAIMTRGSAGKRRWFTTRQVYLLRIIECIAGTAPYSTHGAVSLASAIMAEVDIRGRGALREADTVAAGWQIGPHLWQAALLDGSRSIASALPRSTDFGVGGVLIVVPVSAELDAVDSLLSVSWARRSSDA